MDRKQFMIVLILVVASSFLSSAVIQLFNSHANAETSNNLGHITTKGIALVGEDGKFGQIFIWETMMHHNLYFTIKMGITVSMLVLHLLVTVE